MDVKIFYLLTVSRFYDLMGSKLAHRRIIEVLCLHFKSGILSCGFLFLAVDSLYMLSLVAAINGGGPFLF